VVGLDYGLGIDTGGTYTDAVIYDFKSNSILSCAKSITIKENLTLGINNSLMQLPQELLKKVKFVSISTTLATNACVEGKGGRAVLVLIGCDRDIVRVHGTKYGLPPVEEIIFVDGGHNQQGEVSSEPDWHCFRQKVEEFRNKADSFAVVELWGIRNPDYERKAKQLIMEWTGMPVVCGHELTAEINSLKRAASALLNAQLLPLINDFMNAVKASLKEMNIDAPIAIVRGDGSLMSEKFAREKPVETLLSGPSASAAGGIRLSGEKDCIIVDMGGTTSDLAIVRNGMVRLAHEGVNVGNWKTGTRSILISTVGLGGDSAIRFDNNNDIHTGPMRVAPLSWLADRWPETMSRIRMIHQNRKRHTRPLCEFFYLIRDISGDDFYTQEEIKIVDALKNGPLNISDLSEAVGASIYDINVKRLERLGIIMRSGLTPTDIMHINGNFSKWNTEAALLGAEIMAYQMNIGLNELVNTVDRRVKEMLYFNIVKLLIENEKEDMLKDGVPKIFHDLVMMGVEDNDAINCRFSTNLVLVGIGAPVHIYLPDVAKMLNTRCVITKEAAVANAVGAITGNIAVEEEVIVRPRYEVFGVAGYACYTSEGKKEFADYDEALEWARSEVVRIAEENAVRRGAGQVSVIVDTRNNSVKLSGAYASDNGESGNLLLLETVVTARAIGTLKWI